MNKKDFILFSIFTLTAGLTEFTRCASEELNTPSEQEQAIDQAVIDQAFECTTGLRHSKPNHEPELVKLAAILQKHPNIVNEGNGVIWQTLLHVAVSNSRMPVVQLLLDNGANVNAMTSCRQTSLHLVELSEIAQLLLDNGADVDVTDIYGRSPLCRAIDIIEKEQAMRGAAFQYFQRSPKKLVASLLLRYFPSVNEALEKLLDKHIPNWRRDRAAAFTAARELLDRENFPKDVVDSIVIPMVGKEYPQVAQGVSVTQEPPHKRQKHTNA